MRYIDITLAAITNQTVRYSTVGWWINPEDEIEERVGGSPYNIHSRLDILR